MTINEKVSRAQQLCAMIHNFVSSNIDEIEALNKDVRIAIEINDKTVTSEELMSLRDISLALYDGREWARLTACLWNFSRLTSNLIVMRATNTVKLGLNLTKENATVVMKETKKMIQKAPEMPNIGDLSPEDRQKLVEYLRTGLKK